MRQAASRENLIYRWCNELKECHRLDADENRNGRTIGIILQFDHSLCEALL